MKILVTPTSFSKDRRSEARDLLDAFVAAHQGQIIFNPHGHPLEACEIIPLLDGVDGYIAGLDRITAEVIEKAPSTLKVISRYGAGYDGVDVAAAARKGIKVTNTPGVNAQAVADLALGLMLSVARKIPELNWRVKAGEWPRTTGIELYGKTLGILGLGTIGKGVAMRAQGFSMRVLAYDPCLDSEFVREQGIGECSFDDMIRVADFLSLHLPLNDSTRHIINAEAIRRMKPGAVIINTARGGLIHEEAVYDGLVEGHLGGLGLDVFDREPPGDSPLLRLDRVVATPHAGAHTSEALENMALLSVQNLIDILSQRECRYVVA